MTNSRLQPGGRTALSMCQIRASALFEFNWSFILIIIAKSDESEIYIPSNR